MVEKYSFVHFENESAMVLLGLFEGSKILIFVVLDGKDTVTVIALFITDVIRTLLCINRI